MQFDIIVLGAGVSGLTAAGLLAPNTPKMAILDSYPEPGGNHRATSIGPYTFDIGSFVFREGDALLRVFPEARAGFQTANVEVRRLTPQNSIERYPYAPSNELLGRGFKYLAGSAASVVIDRLRYRKQRTVADYCRYHMGSRIYRDSGLEHYVQRLLGASAEDIEVEFALRRMSWVARAGSLRRRLQRKRLLPPTVGEVLVRDKRGFGQIYEPICSSLINRGVSIQLGNRIRSISRDAAGFRIVTDAGERRCHRLVATIPLQETARMMGIDGGHRLKNIDLQSLYFSFRGARGFRSQILYNFSTRGRWKRLTMYSDLYGRAAGDVEYFTVEIPVPSSDVAELEQEFRQSVAQTDLFRGCLTLEGHESTQFAYPLYTAGATKLRRDLIQQLAERGVESAGRQGKFDYLPTADLAAREVAQQFRVGS